jgi:trimethylamine--corrinoid protein Co-methyltransferase
MTFQPELKVLSDDQVYDIHQAALEILWNTGVLVKAPEARDLLRQAGAWVDDETALCRIPGFVVTRKTMYTCPHARFTMSR